MLGARGALLSVCAVLILALGAQATPRIIEVTKDGAESLTGVLHVRVDRRSGEPFPLRLVVSGPVVTTKIVAASLSAGVIDGRPSISAALPVETDLTGRTWLVVVHATPQATLPVFVDISISYGAGGELVEPVYRFRISDFLPADAPATRPASAPTKAGEERVKAIRSRYWPELDVLRKHDNKTSDATREEYFAAEAVFGGADWWGLNGDQVRSLLGSPHAIAGKRRVQPKPRRNGHSYDLPRVVCRRETQAKGSGANDGEFRAVVEAAR